MEKDSLTKPYYDIEQWEKILLKPEQMNSDILLNLKINLREKIQGKCNKFGYIDKIYKITSKGDGLMEAENLSGGAVYPVKYHCRIYTPLENTIIIGEIILLNQELLIAVNGPIKIFIPRGSVNSSKIDINRNFLLKEKKETLKLNDKVLIRVKDKRINPGDKNIKCIGYLEDIASEKQIKDYYDEQETENNFIL